MNVTKRFEGSTDIRSRSSGSRHNYRWGWRRRCQANVPARLLHHVLKLNHTLSPPHHPSIHLLAPGYFFPSLHVTVLGFRQIFGNTPRCSPSHGARICPYGDSSPACVKSREVPIHAHFQVYPWTPPVTVFSHSVHFKSLYLTAIKLHGIRTSRNPHSLVFALTLLRTNDHVAKKTLQTRESVRMAVNSL